MQVRSILKNSVVIGIAVLLTPCASLVRAEAPIAVDLNAVQRANPIPNDGQLRDELSRLRPEIDRALMVQPLKAQPVPDIRMKAADMSARSAKGIAVMVPPQAAESPQRIEGGAAPGLDLKEMAQAYDVASGIRRSLPGANGLPQDSEFLLFVSFSIPEHKLRRLIEEAADAKATVVFRGPLDEGDTNLAKFGKRLRSLKPSRSGQLQIDPPAFIKYQVSRVPTYVLAKQIASGDEAGACAATGNYASLTGDVLPEYALHMMKERAAPPIAEVAARYAAALANRPPQ